MAFDASGFRLRRDLPALAFVIAAIVGVMLYRRYGVEPRYWAAACIAETPPVGCLPRAAVVWLQGQGLWGWVALAVGLAAFISRRFTLVIAALVLGGAAIVNFNASLGAFGAALGAWTWLRLPHAAPPRHRDTRGQAPPGSAPPRSRSAPDH
ncbi:MAG: hypothetical protein ACREFV_08705 [Acetobacteraceae bacterium]